MRAKFVNEDFRNILKPKSLDDIKRDHQTLIFWKRIIDGARSPKSIKYFLDKNFIEQKAKERGLNQTIRKDWQKQLLYFLDIIDEEKEKKRDDITQELVRKVYNHTRDLHGGHGITAPAAFYVDIKNYINGQYKEINNKYKRVTGQELKEEMVGTYHWNDRQGKPHYTEVYKNPNSIKRMDPGIRGVSDIDGNLYVIDKAGFIHERILDYLKTKGLMRDAGWDYDNHFYTNMVAWQRMKGTNKMYLGESYSDNMDVTHLDWFKELVDKCKAKNPDIEFVEENIYAARSVFEALGDVLIF